MGGEGSSGDGTERFDVGDFAHLTKKGDKVMGAMFYKALMKGFAQWLAAHPGV